MAAYAELGIKAGKTNHAQADRLLGVSAVKVYFSFYRRNGWYSVMATHYASGRCIHLSLDEAKAHIEEIRVQGSVFHIQELPALFCSGRRHAILIAQINRTVPLGDYSVQALPGGYPDNEREPRDSYFTFGASLGALTNSFRSESRFWRITPSMEDVPFIRYFPRETKMEALTKARLRAWQSFSYGGAYYLGWEEIDNRVKQSAVLALCKNAGFGSLA